MKLILDTYLEEASIYNAHFKQRIWVQKRLDRRIGHMWAFLFPSFILLLLTSTEFSIKSFIQFTYQFRMIKIDYMFSNFATIDYCNKTHPFKGQINSKCLFGVIVWTKNQRKNYQNFCPIEAKTEILVIFLLVFCPNNDTKKTFWN